mgnify:CR=1 FL=1
MVKRTGPTNFQLQGLINDLNASECRIWQRVAYDLSKSTRQRRIVNIYKLDKFANEGETVVVPGKILSVGELSKKLDVAAFSFSEEAKKKIINAKGKVLSIHELLQKNPKGNKVRILG